MQYNIYYYTARSSRAEINETLLSVQDLSSQDPLVWLYNDHIIIILLRSVYYYTEARHIKIRHDG